MKKMLLAAAVMALSFNGYAAQDAQAVFDRTCGVCHNGQLPMAPKKGDKAAWEPRLAKGWDTLLGHAINGFNGMPPKGGRVDIPDDKIAAAVAYLRRMLTADPLAVPYVYGVGKVQAGLCLLMVAVLVVIEWRGRTGEYPLLPVRSRRPVVAWSVCLALAVVAFLLGQQEQAFIYFQF